MRKRAVSFLLKDKQQALNEYAHHHMIISQSIESVNHVHIRSRKLMRKKFHKFGSCKHQHNGIIIGCSGPVADAGFHEGAFHYNNARKACAKNLRPCPFSSALEDPFLTNIVAMAC